FSFHHTTTTEIYTLSLHDALPIWNGEDVGRKDDQVGELAALDRALQVLFEGELGIVDREDAQRLFPRDPLVGAVHAVRNRLARRSEEHTSELQSRFDLVCRLLLEK